MKKSLVLLVVMASLLQGCSGEKPKIDTESVSSWKSPLGSFYGTSLMIDVPEPPLQAVWEKRLDAYSKSSPVTAGGAVVCADNAGKVYCLDGKTSETIWTREFKPVEKMQPVIGKNVVYVCDGKPSIQCLDINTGNTVWSADLPGMPIGWPLNGEGRIWVCAGSHLVCYEESVGTQIFDKTYDAEFTVSPTMQLYMYMISGNRLIAVVPKTGETAWTKTFEKNIIAPVSCDRTDIYVVDGRLYKLADKDGQKVQMYTNDRVMDSKTGAWISDPKLEAPFTTGAAIYVNMLVLGTEKGEVLGFQTADISQYVFFHRVNYAVTSTPLVSAKYVWFTAPDVKETGRFFCIANALNARWIWHDWLDEPVSSHPAGTKDCFYVLTDNGLLKRYETGGKPVDPAEDSKRQLDKTEKKP